jgi:hypothetical protein
MSSKSTKASKSTAFTTSNEAPQYVKPITATVKVFHPTFHIQDKQGKIQPSLCHYFLSDGILTREQWLEGKLQLDDGSNWSLHTAEHVDVAFAEGAKNLLVICSFQTHTHGNYAICRIYRKPQTEAKDTK